MSNSHKSLPDGKLSGIEYVTTEWDEPVEVDQLLDSVAFAVRFKFEDATEIEVRWEMFDGSEALVVDVGGRAERAAPTTIFDATARWSVLIGSRMLEPLAGYQETNFGIELWTIRFRLDTGDSIVVALG